MKQKDNAVALLQAVDAGAYVFVCGATTMGEDVLKTIVEIVQAHKGTQNGMCVCACVCVCV